MYRYMLRERVFDGKRLVGYMIASINETDKTIFISLGDCKNIANKKEVACVKFNQLSDKLVSTDKDFRFRDLPHRQLIDVQGGRVTNSPKYSGFNASFSSSIINLLQSDSDYIRKSSFAYIFDNIASFTKIGFTDRNLELDVMKYSVEETETAYVGKSFIRSTINPSIALEIKMEYDTKLYSVVTLEMYLVSRKSLNEKVCIFCSDISTQDMLNWSKLIKCKKLEQDWRVDFMNMGIVAKELTELILKEKSIIEVKNRELRQNSTYSNNLNTKHELNKSVELKVKGLSRIGSSALFSHDFIKETTVFGVYGNIDLKLSMDENIGCSIPHFMKLL